MKKIISVLLALLMFINLSFITNAKGNIMNSVNEFTYFDSQNNIKKIIVNISGDNIKVDEYSNGQKIDTAITTFSSKKIKSGDKIIDAKSIVDFKTITNNQKTPINVNLGKYYFMTGEVMNVTYSEENAKISSYTIKYGFYKFVDIVASIVAVTMIPGGIIKKAIIWILNNFGWSIIKGAINFKTSVTISCHAFDFTILGKDTELPLQGKFLGTRYVVEDANNPKFNDTVLYDSTVNYDEAIRRTEYFHRQMAVAVYGKDKYPLVR